MTRTLLAIAATVVLTGCTTSKPASDLSGAGFVLETPNAATRAFIVANDREFAETVAVNREACQRAPLCRK